MEIIGKKKESNEYHVPENTFKKMKPTTFHSLKYFLETSNDLK